jgi:putative ABC transport system permease protein
VFTAVPPRNVDGDRHPTRGIRRATSTLLRQRRRLLLSTVIVALGVAYLAGSLSLLGRVSTGLDHLAGIGTERADLVIEGDIAVDTPLEQTRRLVPDALVPLLKQVPGVAAAEGRVEDSTVLLDQFHEPIVPLGVTEQPLAANWPTDPDLNPYEFVGSGHPPTSDQEVVIDRSTAERGGVRLGDRITAVTKSEVRSMRVVGIVTRSGQELPAGTSLALFDTATARTLFNRSGDDNSIGITLDRGVDGARVEASIRKLLPYGVDLVDGATFERHRATGLSKSFDLIRVLLLGFAGLAVVVGAFTVANSNALLFARRRQGFALLRLVGASPGQLRAAATAEALFVGLAAVVVGIPLGVLVGRLIEATLGALGTAVPAAGSPISATMIVASVVVGLAVTVLTALLPARDAARSSPIVALTRSDDHVERTLPPLARLGVAVAVGAVLGAICGLLVRRTPGAVAIGAVSGAVAFLVAWLLPRALGRLVMVTTRAFVGPSPSMRSLTALRSRRARSRAASTTAALLLATAVVAGLATLSASLVASFDDQISTMVRADLVVDSGTFTRGGLTDSLVANLRSIPGVTAVSGLRVGTASIGDSAIRLSAVNGRSAMRLLDLGIVDPPRVLQPGQVLLSDSIARAQALHVGSMVDLVFDNAIRRLEVAGVYSARSPLIGDAVIDTSVLAEVTPASIDLVALVDVGSSQPATAVTAVKQLAKSYGVDSVYPPSELVGQRFALVHGFERVVQWMLLFSVLLAVVGIANTLQLSVNERQRELGLLRAVGGGRQQVIRLVLVEAAALSVVGAVGGTAVGLVGVFAAIRLWLASLGLGAFRVPGLVILATAAAAMALGVVGAWLPAVRASGAGIMEALGEDDDADGAAGPFAALARYRDRRRSRRLVDAPQPRRPGERAPAEAAAGTSGPPGSTRGTEDHMARCYNCGNDPGGADRCQVCGAVQVAEPAGMFSTAPTAAAASTGSGRAARSGERWSTGQGSNGTNGPTGPTSRPAPRATPPPNASSSATPRGAGEPQIVDAAVIEDDGPPRSNGTPLGSIFDMLDEDDDDLDVTFRRSPAPEPPPHAAATPPWSPPPPPTPPRPEPSAYATPPPSSPGQPGGGYYPGGPQPGHGPGQTPTEAAPPSSTPSSMVPVHVPGTDPHHLGSVATRMSSEAQRYAAPALLVAGVLLGPDERVVGTVQGWSLGMPTVAILSTSRVLIVCERRWKPIIETFPLRPTLSVYGRHVDDRASMTFQDGDHLITIDQIPDVQLAVEMATATRTQTTQHQGF